MLSSISRYRHKAVALAVHVCIFTIAGLSAFLLRFDFRIPGWVVPEMRFALAVWVVVKAAAFAIFRLEDGQWQFASLVDVPRIAVANVVASLTSTAVILAAGPRGFPRSIYFLDFVVCLLATIGARAVSRAVAAARSRPPSANRVLIYGAGAAGINLLEEIRSDPKLDYQACGFIDDDPAKSGSVLHGMRVFGSGSALPAIVQKYRISQVLIAIPSATGREMTEILRRCHEAHTRCQTIPALSEVITRRGLASQIRELRVEDLLGRTPVRLDEDEIRAKLENKPILITGAAGSIGSEICRQVARFGPRVIAGFEISESALYYLEREMQDAFPGVLFVPEIGSIQDARRVAEVFERHKPSVVYHAAAYKHVPLMEDHIFEAVQNNVFGTRTVALAAARHGADDFVMISSDKAVHPASVMGVTKRVAELMVNSMQNGGTKFVSVRFGNVLGSNGSVVPLFKSQIASGGPVKVTHPDMRRYFMTIPEAAQLVLQAFTMGHGGEIFVLDMGRPIKILDLATNLILLCGMRPGEDISIEFTGIRAGEKLYEDLSSLEEDMLPTYHEKIKIFLGNRLPPEGMTRHALLLHDLCERRDMQGVMLELKEMVPDYSPSMHFLRRALRCDAQSERSGMARVAVAAPSGSPSQPITSGLNGAGSGRL